MSKILDKVRTELERLELPDGGNIVSKDMIRALQLEGDLVRFVLEAPNADMAKMMEPLRAAAERAALSVPGVARAQVALTAHQAPKPAPSPIRTPAIRWRR